MTSSLRILAVPLALAFSAGALFSGDAYAQDREQKEERRVLKADDVDDLANLSEEYRQMARQKRHEEMDFAKELLSRGTMQGEQKAEMMLRLADLYFQEGRDHYLSEMQAYEKKFDACFNDPKCDSKTMSPDNVESKKWQDKSIKLYRQILQNYPTFARADEATFYLASALQDTGQRKDALKEFTRLVKTYPESGYVADAYVQIGEYYFDNNNAYKALLAYQKASAYRDSPKYSFALYKLAWCYYNVGEYGKAIDTMKSVVAYSMAAQQQGASKKGHIQLQDEALKDLVRFFADAGEMDEAYAYFNKLGKKDLIRAMLKRLASTYFEQGKFEQCIQTYRRLIAEDPNSPDAPEYQNEIIQAYTKIGRKKETLTEIDRLLKTYGKNSAWARTNASDQDAVQDAQNYIERNLRTVAINYHTEAKKLGTGKSAKETYALAYKAYSVYLQEFPDSKHSYEMRYAFGELLYKIKRYDEAYVQYMKVVSLDLKGKHSEFCAESAIFAAEEMVKREKKEGKILTAGKGNKTDPIQMSEWERKELDALDQYSKLFPDSKKTKNIIYKSAYLLYNKNQFKEASDRFRVVIGMDPGSKEAMLAANLILDSFTLVEDWQNLKEVSKAFYDQDSLGNKAFKKEVYSIYERASFKLIEVTFAEKKDEGWAADQYVAFYAEFPSSDVADLALNNATVYFHNTDQRGKAMQNRIVLIENFPKSKFFNDQVASLAYDYESMANFQEAAGWYEKLFSLDKEHVNAADSIFSAALFRKAMGDWEAAIKNYKLYMAAYPDKDNIQDITLEVAKIYEENKKYDQAAKVYLTFFNKKDPEGVTADQLMFARLHYGLCLEEIGQRSKAEKHYVETVEWFVTAKEEGAEMTLGVEFAAEIMFKQAQDTYDAYVTRGIDGPTGKVSRKKEDKVLGDNLVAKAKSLQEVEATYSEIINTGAGEWGLASLVQLGRAYENMGESLENSHIPSYLTEDQIEFYRMNLEDKVFPQTEKAVAAYQAALDKSYDLNLYNDQLAFATRRLGELRPDDFPGLEETVLEPTYTSASTTTASFEENL
ncbi:MAG TPA: tetratricopeptide repeat protein [Myxococcota bacterium]|nr:tetratricopeptide repeat protein [Myxococcota bacterium]